MQNKLHGYIYIQRVKTIWKIKSEEQVNITNSQKVKWFFWHVSTLFKDLCLVVSILTNHTFTSLDSIERLFFLLKGFSSLSPWFFICGGKCSRPPILHTAQEYFWRAWQGQTQYVCGGQTIKAGFPKRQGSLDIKIDHVIALMQDCWSWRGTEHSYVEVQYWT
jgi:hypothetical protein